MAHHLVRRLNDLLNERGQHIAAAGEWKRTPWAWRQDWRHRMELLTLDCRALGNPGLADTADTIARIDYPAREAS